MKLIKDRYRLNCLIAISENGANYTYYIKNVVSLKIKSGVKTSHILQNLKQLEKDGYVKGEKMGLGWFWTLTNSGREHVSKVKG